MSAIPAAFAPTSVAGSQHFTVRQRRGWAPWVLVALAAGCLLFGTSLYGVVDGASVLFSIVALLLLGGAGQLYRSEVISIALRASDFEDVEAIEVLGEEQPVLRVLRPDRAPQFIDASAHSSEDARALVTALLSLGE